MSNIWITSDTHFCHTNIIMYENRPFRNTEEMNASMISRWNANVKPLDIVYHIGDFGLGKPEDMAAIRKQLHGFIILIRGNHDDRLSNIVKSGFNGVADELKLQYKDFSFHMTHHPNGDMLYDTNNHTFINIHGHVHGKKRVHMNRINVSCDAWDYTPVTLDDLLMEYRKQRKNNYDKY